MLHLKHCKEQTIIIYRIYLNQLRRSLVRIPASIFSSVEEKLLSKFFDVSIQHRTHFRSKVFRIQKIFAHHNKHEFSINCTRSGFFQLNF